MFRVAGLCGWVSGKTLYLVISFGGCHRRIGWAASGPWKAGCEFGGLASLLGLHLRGIWGLEVS